MNAVLDKFEQIGKEIEEAKGPCTSTKHKRDGMLFELTGVCPAEALSTIRRQIAEKQRPVTHASTIIQAKTAEIQDAKHRKVQRTEHCLSGRVELRIVALLIAGGGRAEDRGRAPTRDVHRPGR
jgi:hypothetical protein